MPFTPRYDFITPFADEAMRLRRETWANPTMLSEELWAIFQQKIPQPKTPPIVIQLNTDSRDGQDFIQFRDKYGGTVGAIDSLLRLTRRTTVQPRETPAIVWADPDRISSGTPLSGTQLNAVAVDPIALTELAGTYEYDPPSGTVLSDGEDQALRVVFTPSNTTSYKRARKTVHIDVGAAVLLVPDITWPTPDDIWRGTALSGTQLNATATDPITLAPVAGVFVYTPPSGTVPDIGDLDVAVDFTPTNTAVYDTNGRNVDFVVKGIRIAGSAVASLTVVAGDIIVVGSCYSDSAGGLTVAVSDGVNTYTQIGSYVRTSVGGVHQTTSLWYAIVGSPGSLTVTVTPTGVGPSSVRVAINRFEGALALDSSSSASGTGGETQSAGMCPVNGDRELVVVFGEHHGTGFAFKSDWSVFGASYAVGSIGNVSPVFGNPTPTAPRGGANVAVDPILSGTATDQWAFIAASFTHRTS